MLKAFKTSYILLPILIGLSVVGWLFYKEFNPDLFTGLHFSRRMAGGILLGFLFIFGRDLGLMARYRLLSDHALSWRQAFNVNTLCEFTSAVTPSAVGGGSLLVLFLNKEGIDAGKSTALMITCLFLDELFLVLTCPVALVMFSFDDLFGNVAILSSGIKVLFFTLYSFILLWTLILYIALFIRPEWVKRLLMRLFRLPLLRRWSAAVEKLTDNLVHSSHEISHRPFVFWSKAFGLTCVSWLSRYLVVNALLIAFTTSGHQLLALVRQLILWVVMIVSPTPGGSGVSEYMFRVYYADFFAVGGMALIVAFVWRVITYYMYLFIGVCILPGWVKKLNA